MVGDNLWGNKYSLLNYYYELVKRYEEGKKLEERGDHFLERFRKGEGECVLAAGLKNLKEAFKSYIMAEDPEDAARIARKLRTEEDVYKDLEKAAKKHEPLGEDSKLCVLCMTYLEHMDTEDLILQYVGEEGLGLI